MSLYAAHVPHTNCSYILQYVFLTLPSRYHTPGWQREDKVRKSTSTIIPYVRIMPKAGTMVIMSINCFEAHETETNYLYMKILYKPWNSPCMCLYLKFKNVPKFLRSYNRRLVRRPSDYTKMYTVINDIMTWCSFGRTFYSTISIQFRFTLCYHGDKMQIISTG